MLCGLLDSLREVEIRPVDAESLRSLGPEALKILQDPGDNPIAAILILLIVSLFLLIVTLAVIAFIGRHGEEDVLDERVWQEAGGDAATGKGSAPRRSSASWHRQVLRAFGILILLLAVMSLSSQSRTVCMSCHTGIAHTDEVAADAHQSVGCIACHEQGGVAESLTLDVLARMSHIVGGMMYAESTDRSGAYGTVTGRACLGCHDGVRQGITDNPDRALQVSHKEPLEAGAGCMDCHILDETERVGRRTVGMSSCLRCHDDREASAECPVCHTGDVSQAVLVSQSHEPRLIVPRPDCYTCHDSGPCDACHGVRLPHPERYDRTHMMDAARDIWFDGSATCTTCHTSERNSCYQRGCHFNELDHHRTEDPGFPRNHGSRQDMPCNDCHPFAAALDDPCMMCHVD